MTTSPGIVPLFADAVPPLADASVHLPAGPSTRKRNGVSSERLAKAVEAAHGPRVVLAHSFPEAAEVAAQALRPDGLLATIGAGDVYRIGELIRGGGG